MFTLSAASVLWALQTAGACAGLQRLTAAAVAIAARSAGARSRVHQRTITCISGGSGRAMYVELLLKIDNLLLVCRHFALKRFASLRTPGFCIRRRCAPHRLPSLSLHLTLRDLILQLAKSCLRFAQTFLQRMRLQSLFCKRLFQLR